MNKELTFLLYNTPDNNVSIRPVIKDDTIWLTQHAMAELFGIDVSGIAKHIKNIFNDGELAENSVIANFANSQKTATYPLTKPENYYNLDMIIAVGYRVNSKKATAFRIWTTLGSKTMELVHQNLEVGEVHDDIDILHMDAELIDDFIEKQKDIKKTTKKVEIDLVSKIRKHSNNPKFVQLGQKLEDLREKHEKGLVTSIEFLKLLLELAREAAQAEKEVIPEEEIDKGKAALTELFNGVKNTQTPIMVERIVNDIDEIVKYVRFPDWQNTTAGIQEIKKALRSIVWIKYKIKDKEVFDKAYQYIEQYY